MDSALRLIDVLRCFPDERTQLKHLGKKPTRTYFVHASGMCVAPIRHFLKVQRGSIKRDYIVLTLYRY